MIKTNGMLSSIKVSTAFIGLSTVILSTVPYAMAEDAPADGSAPAANTTTSETPAPEKAKKNKKEKKDSKGWNGQWPKKGEPSDKAGSDAAVINRENGEEPEIKTDADKRPDKEEKKEAKASADPNRPFNPEAIKEYNQGVEFQQQDMLNQAIQKYKHAIELDERLERAWCNLGLIYTSQRNFSRANDAFKKALVLKPNNPYSLNGMGSVLYSKNKLPEAMEKWQKAIEVDPNFFSVYFNMGNAWDNEKQFEKALENYVMTIKTNGQMAEPYYKIGVIFEKQKHTAQAQAMLSRAIQLNPEGEFVADAKKQLAALDGVMGKEDTDNEVKMRVLAPPIPEESK